MEPPVRPTEYYQHPQVQARMREDLGGVAMGTASAAYLSGLGPSDGPLPRWEAATIVPPHDVARLWAAGADVARSLWDDSSLIFFIDVDYQNIDEPAEPFLRPAEVFVTLEPTYRAVRPPGDGRIDWTEITRTLRTRRFSGWIMLELHAPNEDPETYLRRALDQARGRLDPSTD